VYEALQQQKPVFVKVAHPGASHRDRLIREARFLLSLRAKKGARYPTLPDLLPPYTTTTLEQDAFGTIGLGRELLHYYLFEPVEGQSLDQLLLQQPQWWVHHVGWLSIELAKTVNALHLNGLFHFGLTPASVLVRFGKKPFAPHIVLCDLGIASDAEGLARDWYTDFAPLEYLAPELLGASAEATAAGVQTDVYGLGLVLYEMLAGQPAFASAMPSHVRTVNAVSRGDRLPMSRVEDVSPVATIALRASSAIVAERPATAADVAEELLAVFGEMPEKRSSPLLPLNTLLVLGGTALLVVFLVTLAISLSAVPGQ
jgi:serine/threonine protein kinase